MPKAREEDPVRLVESSDPGAVERFEALRLLQERVVLTTAVCRELQRTGGTGPYGRADAALSLLHRWIAERFETDPEVGVHPDDGIEDMVIPDGALDLVDELWAGTRVCQAFGMLHTADRRSEYEGDQAEIRRLLERYPY